MNKLKLVAVVAIGAGTLMKFLHADGSDIILILGVGLFVVYSMMFFVKNVTTDAEDAIAALACATWSLFLLFLWMFWPDAVPLFLASLVLTGVWFMRVFKKGVGRLKSRAGLLFCMAFGILSFFTPAVDRYYFLHFNRVLYSASRAVDYKAWDKYSWHLYSSGYQQEAIDANQQAQKAFTAASASTKPAREHWRILKTHEQQIREKTWQGWVFYL